MGHRGVPRRWPPDPRIAGIPHAGCRYLRGVPATVADDGAGQGIRRHADRDVRRALSQFFGSSAMQNYQIDRLSDNPNRIIPAISLYYRALRRTSSAPATPGVFPILACIAVQTSDFPR